MSQELNIQNRSAVILWLFSGCLLIFLMVVVGGITRLTGSGLSITRWDVVTGSIPPMSEAAWEKEFAHYQESPQYKLINSHFGIHEFKQIYWWEYIHRLIGRIIGLVFIIPFIWFLIRKQLSKDLIWKSLILFGMGGLQGFIGWYMVSSGLVDIPSVSHYRLALHLITAFFTFGLTFWFAFELINTEKLQLTGWKKGIRKLAVGIFAVTVLQIIYGAFVAGMKAGHIYNTWPLMGDSLIAESVFYAFKNLGWAAFVNNLSGVQFIHRYLAYVVLFLIFFLAYRVFKMQKSTNEKLLPSQLGAVYFVVAIIICQFILGVLTLIYNVPVWMGVTHQVFAFILFAAEIYLIHLFTRQSVADAKLTGGLR
jgi:cytochrome c oxidase assembly protein subunit 15